MGPEPLTRRRKSVSVEDKTKKPKTTKKMKKTKMKKKKKKKTKKRRKKKMTDDCRTLILKTRNR